MTAAARGRRTLLLLVGLLLISPCLGLGASVAFINAYTNGVFSRWQPLGAPPAPALDFVAATDVVVYVHAGLDDGVYACRHLGRAASDACWEPITEPIEISNDFERDGEPVFRGQAPAPPGRVVDELTVTLLLAEVAAETRYALLDDGTVWMWEYGVSAYDNLFILMAGPVVCLIGAAVLLGVAAVAGRRRRANIGASA